MSMSDVIWHIPHLQPSLLLLLFSILTSPFLPKKLLIVHIKQKQRLCSLIFLDEYTFYSC